MILLALAKTFHNLTLFQPLDVFSIANPLLVSKL
jgi:hypothetical protein